MAKLYGVGVGPGDPELITVKAVNIIKKCSVIAFPDMNTAYKIAKAACPEIEAKELAALKFLMTGNKEEESKAHQAAAFSLEKYLDEDKDIAFLTLGDPCIYSTFMYIEKIVAAHGYETEIISGVPSFCAAGAAFKISLAEGNTQLHIVTGGGNIAEAAKYKGNKVIMKAGKSLKAVKQELLESGNQAYIAVNCGMQNEKLYTDINDLDSETGYFSLAIIREGGV